jgi:hemolysin III
MKLTIRATTVIWNYNRAEIIADGIVHTVGIALGLTGATVLLVFAFHAARRAEIAPVIIYLVGLLSMLGFSAAYNLWPISPRKWMLRRFDHSSIYLLIAATYTPLIWHAQSGILPIVLLIVVWLTAAAGIALKLGWPERFDGFSIVLYLLLGWVGIIAYVPVSATLQPLTLWLIAIGGAFYSLGVPFHLWERLRFHTVIWHCFVLTAACCHYTAVLSCVMQSI